MSPYYDYKCTNENCDYNEGKILPIENRDDPLSKPCPKCDELGVIREFGSPVVNLSFRGSTIQSSPKLREFQETVLGPIKKGLGKSGRVRSIE
jgi:hypothetical protein